MRLSRESLIFCVGVEYRSRLKVRDEFMVLNFRTREVIGRDSLYCQDRHLRSPILQRLREVR